jgi:hypothetical protein
MSYRIDEERFCYNKNSNKWFCVQGNKTEIKKCDKDKHEKDFPSKISCISSKFKEDSKHPILFKTISINLRYYILGHFQFNVVLSTYFLFEFF